MANFLNYLDKNQKSFDNYNFNNIDSLVLAYLSYLHYPSKKIKLKDLDISLVTNSKNKEFIKRVVTSNRYKDIEFCFYKEETNDLIEKQFSAITFLLPNNTMYISFRGTDSTLTGWKEDFNMSFIYPVPSQKEALNYVEKVTRLIPRKFYIGGHSKGGNLAVYAGCNINTNNIKDRLIKIYNLDGPGFIKEFFTTSNYLNVKEKIEKIVPHSSIIGMLLCSNEPYKVIKSNKKGIFEHDPFSWQIKDNDFITLKSLSEDTVYTNKVINDFISNLSKKEREIFTDSLFIVLKSTNLTTLDEISKKIILKIPSILKAIYNLDTVNKKYILKTIMLLIKSYIKNSNLLNSLD